MTDSIKISIAIKALNEQNNIEACIESVLAQTFDLQAQVILVDSLSDDQTVILAKRYPIRIVQLTKMEDRGCGCAAQLAYSLAKGHYFYLLDGDMVLQAGFLRKAIAYLDEHSDVAGVSGKLLDTHIITSADKRRQSEYAKLNAPQEVISLGGGGLYRCSMIDNLGYFAHSELKACEELELGVRIKCAGWKMVRLPDLAVSHTGHNESQFKMITRLWKNGRLKAYSSFLKSAFGKKHFLLALKSTWFIFMPVVLGILPFFSLWLMSKNLMLSTSVIACIWIGFVGILSIKKKSLIYAINSIILWWLLFLAAIPSLFSSLHSPKTQPTFKEIQ